MVVFFSLCTLARNANVFVGPKPAEIPSRPKICAHFNLAYARVSFQNKLQGCFFRADVIRSTSAHSPERRNNRLALASVNTFCELASSDAGSNLGTDSTAPRQFVSDCCGPIKTAVCFPLPRWWNKIWRAAA